MFNFVFLICLFSESVHEYSKLLIELDHVAKRMVFESYGVDMKRCESFIESGNNLLRCLQYRPPQVGETDLGMQPHTDLTVQSILHQVNNVDGLEVKLKNGEWVVVDPSPSMFVVMAGDGFKVSQFSSLVALLGVAKKVESDGQST